MLIYRLGTHVACGVHWMPALCKPRLNNLQISHRLDEIIARAGGLGLHTQSFHPDPSN